MQHRDIQHYIFYGTENGGDRLCLHSATPTTNTQTSHIHWQTEAQDRAEDRAVLSGRHKREQLEKEMRKKSEDVCSWF